MSPLATTISTRTAAPAPAGIRLRAGQSRFRQGARPAGSGEAITTAKAAGARTIPCRGDSAVGNGKVIAAAVNGGAGFPFVLTKSRPVLRAIGTIADDAWTPVRYPGAVP